MDKMKRVLFIVAFALALFSCGKNTDILSEKKMANVIRDIYMTDGTLNIYRYNLNHYINIDSVYYYKVAFDKNKVTRDQFVRSLNYYGQYPKKLDQIYALVVNDLSSLQSEVKAEYDKANKKKSGKSAVDSIQKAEASKDLKKSHQLLN